MNFKSLVLSALLLPLVSTQTVGGEGNLTISFFADDQEASCQNDPGSGLVLTTSTLPTTFTCFNVSDIFSQDKDAGFQKASQTYYDDEGNVIEPNGVYWFLPNQDDYDTQYDLQANYSRVWYEQTNLSQVEPDKDGTWVFYIYAFDDCEQLSPNEDTEPEEFPWFETSCQTETGGQCQTVPRTIRSFGILPAADYNQGKGQCNVWAFMGAAPSFGPQALLFTASVGLAVILLAF